MLLKKLKILHLEDVPTDAELVERELKKGNIQFEKVVVDNREDFEEKLFSFKPDIILSDHSLPSFNSFQALQVVHEKKLNIPFILITASISEEFAVNVMRSGAYDYILKDRLQRLTNAIVNAMDKWEITKERKAYFDKVIKNETLLKEAQRIANLGNWEIDFTTQEYTWSDEVYKILALPTTAHVSPDLFISCIHPEDLEYVKQMMNDVLLTRENISYDFRIKRPNGEIRFISSKSEYEFDENRNPIRLHGIIHDVTEQKKYIQSIEEQNVKLREIAWLQSHVVRAPLARMMGLIDVLENHKNHVTLPEELINYISTSANELDNIIRQIISKTEKL